MAYAAVVLQAITYYQNCQNDPLMLKALVSVTLILDTANLVGQYGYAYLLCVTAQSNPAVIFSVMSLWPIVLITFTGPVLMTFLNTFLIRRLYFLSKSHLLAGVLVSLQLSALGLALFNASKMVCPPATAKDLEFVTATLITALCLYVTIDTGIAISMLWHLTKLRTPYPKTRAMVHRLMRMILQSGTATTVISITLLIVFLTYPPLSVASTAVTFLISHFYSLTLFFNLNVREQMRKQESTVSRNGNSMESGVRELTEIYFRGYGTSIVLTEPDESSRVTTQDSDPKPVNLRLGGVRTWG